MMSTQKSCQHRNSQMVHGRLENLSFLITGGAGYAGCSLAKALLECGVKCVRVLDLYPTRTLLDLLKRPETYGNGLIEYIRGDIRDEIAVDRAVRGMDGVFHMCSFGMSGKEMLSGREKIESINCGGTKLVLQACDKNQVENVVYTSTNNVIFYGQEIRGLSEDELPYPPLSNFVDEYSRSKSLAERIVLAPPSNVRTISLRSCGIYGEEENRHLPRIADLIRRGLFCFIIGSCASLVDWIYVDNFVEAHLLAMEALVQGDSRVIGEAFFISDDEPINQFLFIKKLLVDPMRCSFPRICVPISIMYRLGHFVEILYALLSPAYNFMPLITRTEVNVSSVTHYFNINKAKRLLHYSPVVSSITAMDRVAKHYAAVSAPQGPFDTSGREYALALVGVVLMFCLFRLLGFFVE